MESLIGKSFERLTVVERASSPNKHTKWLCLCSCGTYVTVWGANLRRGTSRSCGCLHRELVKARNAAKTKVDWSDSPLYSLWSGIKQRCGNPRNRSFSNYGGRGVVMFPEWSADFGSFRDWVNSNLGPRPQGQTLDRIDNDGNYEPGNLRWATGVAQSANARPKRRNSEFDTVTAERDLWRQRALTLGWVE
jgi:hypothetical protein